MLNRPQNFISSKKTGERQQLGFQKLFFNETEDQYEQSKLMNLNQFDQILNINKKHQNTEKKNTLTHNLNEKLYEREKSEDSEEIDDDSEFELTEGDSEINDIIQVDYQMMRLQTLIQNQIQEFVQEGIFQSNILEDIGRLRFILIQFIRKTIQKSVDSQEKFSLDIYLLLIEDFRTLEHFISHQYPYLEEETNVYEDIIRYQEMNDQEFQDQFDLMHERDSINEIIQYAQISALLGDQSQFKEFSRMPIPRNCYNQSLQVGPLDDAIQKKSFFDSIGNFNSENKNESKYSVNIRKIQRNQIKQLQSQLKNQSKNQPKNKFQLFNLPSINFDKSRDLEQQSKVNTSTLTYQQFVALLDKQKKKKQQREKKDIQQTVIKQNDKKSQFDSILGKKSDNSNQSYMKPFITQLSSKQENNQNKSFFGEQKKKVNIMKTQNLMDQRFSPSSMPLPRNQQINFNDVIRTNTNESVQRVCQNKNSVSQNISEKQQPLILPITPNPHLNNVNNIRGLNDLGNIENPNISGNQHRNQLDKTQNNSDCHPSIVNLSNNRNTTLIMANQIQKNIPNQSVNNNFQNPSFNSQINPQSSISYNQKIIPISNLVNNQSNTLKPRNPAILNATNSNPYSPISNTTLQTSKFEYSQITINSSNLTLRNQNNVNGGQNNIRFQGDPKILSNSLNCNIASNAFPKQASKNLYQPQMSNLYQTSNSPLNTFNNVNTPLNAVFLNHQSIQNPVLTNVHPQFSQSINKDTIINPFPNQVEKMCPQEQSQHEQCPILDKNKLSSNSPRDKKEKVTKIQKIKKIDCARKDKYDQATLSNMKLKDFVNKFCHNQLRLIYHDLFSQLLIARKWKLINFKVDSTLKEKLSYLSKSNSTPVFKLAKKEKQFSLKTRNGNIFYPQCKGTKLKDKIILQSQHLQQSYLLMKLLSKKINESYHQSLSQSNVITKIELNHKNQTSQIQKMKNQFDKIQEIQSLLQGKLDIFQKNLETTKKQSLHQKENTLYTTMDGQLSSISKSIQSLQDWIISNNLCTISGQNKLKEDVEAQIKRQNTIQNETIDFQVLRVIYNSINHIQSDIQSMDYSLQRLQTDN